MNRLLRGLRPSPILSCPAPGAVPKPRKQRGPPQVPLANELANTLRREGEAIGKGANTPYGPLRRVNVVDEQLCDDTLSFLGPSLEAYKGCDVLDIFPGVGLWSRKVHEYLKPRSHTLVDTNQDGFKPYLKQLVDQPGSRYQYKPFDMYPDGRNARRTAYEDPSVLNQLRANSPGDSEWPLLVLATCTVYPYRLPSAVKSSSSTKIPKIADSIPLDVSPSEDLLFQIIRQITTLPEHHSRPTRILLWTLDRDKLNYLPRSAAGRKVSAVEMEEIFEMQEVVGWSKAPGSNKGSARQAQYELESAAATVRRMAQHDVTLPQARCPTRVTDIQAALSSSDESQFTEVFTSIEQLRELTIRNSFDSYSTQHTDSLSKGRQKKLRISHTHTQAIHKSLEKALGTGRPGIPGLIYDKVGSHLILLDLERSIASGRSTHRYIHASTSAPGGFEVRPPCGGPALSLDDLSARLVSEEDGGHVDNTTYVARNIIDNDWALHRPEPFLVWDRRSFEPLESHAEDFFPQYNLALLDLTPKSRSARPSLTNLPTEPHPSLAKRRHNPASISSPARITGSLSYLPFVRHLIRLEARPLPTALDRLSHGAAEALLPQCPSIHDPLKGGRMKQNLQHFRVRMLTLDHLKELAEAWYAWPFRKSDMELYSEMGRSSIFEDFDTK